MRILYFFLGRRAFLRENVVVLIMAVVLVEALSVSIVHAIGGQAAFEINPVFSDPNNPVTTSYFVMNAQPATHQQNSIRVTNIGSQSGTVNLYPVDAFTAAAGGTTFHTRTDARIDVGAWITLSRRQLTLAPSQSQIVPFRLTIPSHVRAGQHVGGIVVDNTALQTFTSKNVPIKLQQLRIIAVQVNLPGTAIEKLVVTGIHPGSAGIYQRLLLGLSNAGNMMVKSSGNLQIFDSNGHLLQNQALQLDTFLPQTSINDPIYIQHRALSIGQYKAVLTLIYGHNQHLHYTTMFTITASKKNLTNAVSTLVSLGDTQSFLSLLSPWQVAVGGGVLLLVMCTLGSWLYKLFIMLPRLRFGGKQSEKTQPFVYSESINKPVGEPVDTKLTKLTKRQNVR
ncbi:MAG: DUF916 domain-containing protein [Ktedonobacteraceae bacterium]|nr:DUF916 domain-containing protein [Ktedonobacteraceae bacterium]